MQDRLGPFRGQRDGERRVRVTPGDDQNRNLPPLQRGDLLATFSAGAYGMSMSSNYNSRPRAAEVLVTGTSHRLIRRRETFDDLVRAEVEV